MNENAITLSSASSSLLPPNATELERCLEASMDYPLNVAVMKPHPCDLSTSSAELFDRYQLGELTQWLSDSALPPLEEALACQRIKGTPQALRLVLGWLGIHAITVEDNLRGSHFAEYQIGVNDAVVSGDTLNSLMGLSHFAIPIRSRCRRIYNGAYDHRYLVLSESPDGGRLSDDSGMAVTLYDKTPEKMPLSQPYSTPLTVTVSFGRAYWGEVTLDSVAVAYSSTDSLGSASVNSAQSLDGNPLATQASLFFPRMIVSTQERGRVVQVLVDCVAGGWHHDFFTTDADSNDSLSIRGNELGDTHGYTH